MFKSEVCDFEGPVLTIDDKVQLICIAAWGRAIKRTRNHTGNTAAVQDIGFKLGTKTDHQFRILTRAISVKC